MDQHIISGAYSNVQGSKVCRLYFLVFRAEVSGIAITLFLDLAICCFIKMECKRLAFKITLYKFLDIRRNTKLYDIIYFPTALAIIFGNIQIRKHAPVQIIVLIARVKRNVIFNNIQSTDNYSVPHLLLTC